MIKVKVHLNESYILVQDHNSSTEAVLAPSSSLATGYPASSWFSLPPPALVLLSSLPVSSNFFSRSVFSLLICSALSIALLKASAGEIF